ncbi:F0F1 ATP synthase subunit B [Alkalitalea saponilacus]|uniref:ATP synthase subunit b n=1 Tax=Alkalitalea saponilacus TaxID=889453 RepID=A0A1T5EFJ7_9BACT|nr:F0F1 ATP synthase subunit B [Alkalitalea saponilacus]ASB49005.1 ATP synthase F0 subunit B [Alkalitalea saponilacus]SKB82470.1 F-type H+-transporting ATPase subunit b [Alkalitalea saponilacus]
MGLLTPDPGLIFWTTTSFLILMFLLRRYAWKPILRALKVREEYIEFSLKDAAQAKDEVAKLSETRRQMIESTRLEREKMMRETRGTREEIINEAKASATREAEKIIQQSRELIERERQESLSEIRQQISLISLEIAEKILKQELVSEERQQSVIREYLDHVNFN